MTHDPQMVIVRPCPPHIWAYAPTVGYYTCMHCSERRDYNHALYADAAREYHADPLGEAIAALKVIACLRYPAPEIEQSDRARGDYWYDQFQRCRQLARDCLNVVDIAGTGANR